MNLFNAKSTNRYVLNQEDLFQGVDNLVADSSYRIISFGLNLEYFINNFKIKGLNTHDYKGIKIHSFPYSPRFTGNTIFIVKESELPWIKYLEIEEEFVTLYEYELINEDYYLYGSVSDLNRNEMLRNALIKTRNNNEDELKKKVFQAIGFRSKISWLVDMKMVSITVKNNWDNQKKASDLKDIKRI